jgi:hypothetical protein
LELLASTSCKHKGGTKEPQLEIKREKMDVHLLHVKDEPVDPSSEGMVSIVSSWFTKYFSLCSQSDGSSK